jgi:hypothetical protein
MKLGNMLFEAKLTEGDFQIQRAELVEGYCSSRQAQGFDVAGAGLVCRQPCKVF